MRERWNCCCCNCLFSFLIFHSVFSPSFNVRFFDEIDIFLERSNIGGEVSGDFKEKYKNAK